MIKRIVLTDNQNIQLGEVEQKNLELILEYERKQSEAVLP